MEWLLVHMMVAVISFYFLKSLSALVKLGYFWNKDDEARFQEEVNFNNVVLITSSFDLF